MMALKKVDEMMSGLNLNPSLPLTLTTSGTTRRTCRTWGWDSGHRHGPGVHGAHGMAGQPENRTGDNGGVVRPVHTVTSNLNVQRGMTDVLSVNANLVVKMTADSGVWMA